mgnify:CR=1 FL=1
MITIKRATVAEHMDVLNIGRISVKQAHIGSCPAGDLDEYMRAHYNREAIMQELEDIRNVYHILYFNDMPVGFSKLVLNAAHENIREANCAKLDRIYLLPEYFDKKLGVALLSHNIDLAKQNDQSGIWLVTWIGNTRAIAFYTRAGFQVIGSYQFRVTPTSYNLNHQMRLPL